MLPVSVGEPGWPHVNQRNSGIKKESYFDVTLFFQVIRLGLEPSGSQVLKSIF
jgi:hypothetical protein